MRDYWRRISIRFCPKPRLEIDYAISIEESSHFKETSRMGYTPHSRSYH
jgi:hypothetical protein